MTFYLFDTESQAGMTLEATNPTSNFREGDKTLTKQLMPLVRNVQYARQSRRIWEMSMGIITRCDSSVG